MELNNLYKEFISVSAAPFRNALEHLAMQLKLEFFTWFSLVSCIEVTVSSKRSEPTPEGVDGGA